MIRTTMLPALFAAILGSLLPTTAIAGKPTIRWGGPMTCIDRGEGKQTRLQCTDEGGKCECLRVGNRVTGPDGKETDRYLEGLMGCTEYRDPFFLEQLAGSGCSLVDAIAEAPPGFARDENGRLFQVSFDLTRRLYLGGHWLAMFDPESQDLSRGGVDFGFRVDDLDYSGRKRHRHQLLVGEVSFLPVDFDVLLWGYDLGARRDEPALWVTTFIGPPTRFDFDLDLGWGFRMLTARYHPMRSKSYSELENLSLYVSWELYHNRPMDSFIRFAIGPGCGEMFSEVEKEETRFSVYPMAALESELVLDRRGLNRLAFNVGASPRWYLDDMDALYWTGRGSLSYELILLAINDQPLSLYLEGNAQYRDDIPDAPSDWQFEALAGLRFNFWAPPREAE